LKYILVFLLSHHYYIIKMSADGLVYDMASATEGSPDVFVKKDWLNILDNQNGNYVGNQCVIDTSQLANSNKWMHFKEAYLAIPMVLTATNGAVNDVAPLIQPATAATSADMSFGLKNWWGSIIHSMTLDFNGTTIVQQTPLCGLWNTFRLMTSLSYQDVLVNGSHMGFYPDNALTFSYVAGTDGTATTAGALDGVGVCNNRNFKASTLVNGQDHGFDQGNDGFLKRQQYIAFDPAAITGGLATAPTAAYSVLLDSAKLEQQYKSFINKKEAPAATAKIQYSIMATVHLKHIHSFFQNIPLMKGVFMKLTLNLNQTSFTISTAGLGGANNYTQARVSVNSPLGGVSPLMTASKVANNGSAAASTFAVPDRTLTVSLAVGNKPVIQAHSGLNTSLSSSVQLYVPAYTFNPQYESAYISSPVKKIVYTDIYQYQVLNVAANQSFNNLLTNGIANIKSVLVLPFFTRAANGGLLPYQSPFDPAGCGPTSPLCLLTNFNVVVGGQNAIYNTQKYSYEQFLNQLNGANAINGNLTDGLTSGLVDKLSFEHEYCYYYVDVSRSLPVDKSVPKSVSIVGTNSSKLDIDLMCFIEYETSITVDVLVGARVG
jgi:hypothetical protein